MESVAYRPLKKFTHPFSLLCIYTYMYSKHGMTTIYNLCFISLDRQLPTFNGDVRTRLLDQSQRRFDLNTSPELRQFILGSHLRLRLVDYFTTSTTLQHQYFSILEITIAAR